MHFTTGRNRSTTSVFVWLPPYEASGLFPRNYLVRVSFSLSRNLMNASFSRTEVVMDSKTCRSSFFSGKLLFCGNLRFRAYLLSSCTNCHDSHAPTFDCKSFDVDGTSVFENRSHNGRRKSCRNTEHTKIQQLVLKVMTKHRANVVRKLRSAPVE